MTLHIMELLTFTPKQCRNYTQLYCHAHLVYTKRNTLHYASISNTKVYCSLHVAVQERIKCPIQFKKNG